MIQIYILSNLYVPQYNCYPPEACRIGTRMENADAKLRLADRPAALVMVCGSASNDGSPFKRRLRRMLVIDAAIVFYQSAIPHRLMT